MTQNKANAASHDIGSETILHSLVGAFYFSVLNDNKLAPFFRDTDMGAILHHQHQFLTLALQGPAQYSTARLVEAHANLVTQRGLNDSHFDAMVTHLRKALTDFAVAEEACESMLAVIESLRDAILGRS